METTEVITTVATIMKDAEKYGNNINNGGNFYFTVILSFFSIFLVIGGLLFFRKYLLKRLGNVKNGKYMKIIDRLVVSQDKQIILIETKTRLLIVGITQQRMETLAEFSKSESESNEDFGAVGVVEMRNINNTDSIEIENIDDKSDRNNKNNGFFDLLNEKIKTGFDKLNDRNKNKQ